MTNVMLLVMLLVNPAVSEDSGWVVSIAVFDNEESAAELAAELEEQTVIEVDYLYIPDWESLSGYDGWLVYAGSFSDPAAAASLACNFLYRFPDVYAIELGHDDTRSTIPPEPQYFLNLTGIMPRWPEYFAENLLERIHVEDPNEDLCDCMIPEFWKLSIPGWEMTGCRDSYIGMVEERAYRTGEYDPEEEYTRASAFLRENAEDLGLAVYEDPGVFTLVHQLPDPVLRESDSDVWVALRNDTLQYGSRIRLFYGYYRETWHHIPPEWHDSFLPDVITNSEEAIEYLMTALIWSGIYSSEDLEGFSFGVEWLGEQPEEGYRDYFDIAIREVHQPGGPGDPNTAPIVDRFRVYTRGEVIWFRMPQGEFVPFEERLVN